MKKRTKFKVEVSSIRPAIFMEAARLLGEHDETYACMALDEAICETYGHDSVEKRYFIKILKPRGALVGDPWYSMPFYSSEDRTARIIGLLLCARLAKEGFNPWA